MDEYTADSRFDQAREFLENERDMEAESAFSDLIELYPEWEGAYGNRGLARLHLGCDSGAFEDFYKVTCLSPDDAMAYSRMAEAQRNLGDYQGALDSAVKALELDEDDPDAHYIRGWLFFYYGQYEAAMSDLRAFTEITQEPSEIDDMLDLSTAFAAVENLSTDQEEKSLRENGFSRDFSYNENFVEESLFCPYAHCIRLQPCRGPQAPDVCMATGFSCPGGAEVARSCSVLEINDVSGLKL